MSEGDYSASESRDVAQESDSSSSAQFDSNQYQTGDDLRASSTVDDTSSLGFANTSIDGATENDTKYSPASAMTQDQAPPADQPAVTGEQTPPEQATRGPVVSHGEVPDAPLPNTKTEELKDGNSATTSWDNSTAGNTRVVRDADGNISSIKTNAGSSGKEVTTNYSPDGKPTSQVSSDGAVTYDESGNITSDTRSNPVDKASPESIQKTQNPDGSTTYNAPNSDGTYQNFTFRENGSLASTVQKTSDGTTRENDFYENGAIKEQRLSNDKPFNNSEVNNTWDQNGVARSTETKNAKGWERAESDAQGRPTRESGGTYDGKNMHETNYTPNGDISSHTVHGDHVSHMEIKKDGSYTTTDTNRATQEVNQVEFKPGEGSTRIQMTPYSIKSHSYDAFGNERMDKRVDRNYRR